MPIVGTVSAEVQMDTSVAEFPQGVNSSVNGCTLLKRRSQQDLEEEARAEKRVRIEGGGGGMSCTSLQENGADPIVPLRSVEGCPDTSKGDELTKVEDDSKPSVQGDENPTAVGNGTDLSDLLRDLGASDDDDDVGFGGDIPSEPGEIPSEPGLFEELLGNSIMIESEIQAQIPPVEPIINNAASLSAQVERSQSIGTEVEANPPQAQKANPPETETIIKADDISSEMEARDDSEIKVQAHQTEPIINSVGFSSEVENRDNIGNMMPTPALEKVGKDKSLPEVITLDSESDDDNDDGELMMFDPVQLQDAVNPEFEGLGQVPNGSPLVGNSVKVERGTTMQVPNVNPQVGNHVMGTDGNTRQLPNGSPLVENPVKVERGTTMQVSNVNPQVGNHVTVGDGNTTQLPNGSPQVENSVKVEHGSTRHVPHSSEPRQGPTLPTDIVQAPPGGTVQMRIENGKLVPYVKYPGPNLSRMPFSPSGGNPMHSVIRQADNLPYRHPNGGPTSIARNNGYAQETSSSGEQGGRSHGLNALTTSAAVPSSRDQAGPSHRWNPSATSTAAPTSGDQAGPSQRWNPSNNSAVVPFSNGANKAEPGLHDNTNLGPQSGSAQNQLAVVRQHYDTTVSNPRYDVARAMQNYDYYITKAKNDRVREATARIEATPNELVKEGQRRGLDCRPDIVAYNNMKRDGEDVNKGIIVGDLPGVEIGDRFSYRHQMAVVGLHRLPNVGIDYGHVDMIPTATAIVLMPKAGYVDDKDYGNIILYTGQGGRKKRNQGAPFVCDQELKKGNLALAKNYERKLPVRVIRGHSGLGSGSGSGTPGLLGYTYDGLYVITKYEFNMGLNGFNVYKFSMERLEGQPPIPPCIAGCRAHEWNTARGALGAVPLQVMEPAPVEEDVKQLCI